MASLLNVLLIVVAFYLCFVDFTVEAQWIDASDFCFQCRSRKNQKDMYVDPEDCHNFYHCLYVNETFAYGIKQFCGYGTFFHEPILQCMPELAATPCEDPCLSDRISAIGWYPGTGCRQYFVCANTASNAMCCPLGTIFNVSAGSCDASDETCADDPCSLAMPTYTPPVFNSILFNSSVCQDHWGNYISIVPKVPNAFSLIDENGDPTTPQYCAPGVAFNISSCLCDIDTGITIPPLSGNRRAILWLPLDSNIKDNSVNKWATFLYDGAKYDSSVSVFGSGGSLNVDGGFLSVPGLKSFDFLKSASWCAFFRCESGGNNCATMGGILSNNKDASSSEFTVVVAVQGLNNLIGKVDFWHPAGTQSTSSAFSPPANGWNHVCLTYDSNSIKLYLNGQLADSESISGYLAIAKCPFVVGNDQAYGSFVGHIDEVLVTPFAMTIDEINAHRTGDRVYLSTRGFW